MSHASTTGVSTFSSYILCSLAAADRVSALPRVSTRARRAGVVVSALPVVFLLVDALVKVLGVAAASDATAQLGWPTHLLLPLGVLQLICLALYLRPQTSVLGAVLWTGYLGGAVATHVRIGNPLFSHVLFPVYIGVLLWLGLWLRDCQGAAGAAIGLTRSVDGRRSVDLKVDGYENQMVKRVGPPSGPSSVNAKPWRVRISCTSVSPMP